MPVNPTYPGVYVQEIPSGVRTITGVATSIAAFIGRALRGPTNKAVTITSYADFERVFGGLWVESMLGYAVRDFYLNGGSTAVIVRLFHPNDSKSKRLKLPQMRLSKQSMLAQQQILRISPGTVVPKQQQSTVTTLAHRTKKTLPMPLLKQVKM